MNYYIIEHATRGIYLEHVSSYPGTRPKFSHTKGRSEGRRFHTAEAARETLAKLPGWPHGCYVMELPTGKRVVEPVDVTCITTIKRDGVYYAVLRDGVEVWSKFIKFGKASMYRAGGFAFRQAAQEQERLAGPTFTETIGRDPEAT